MQGQHSVQPRRSTTQTSPTLGRQQSHSCKGETPAGKANRERLGKGTVYTCAPLSPLQGNEITICRTTGAFCTEISWGRVEIRFLDGPHRASKMSWVLPPLNLNGCLGLWWKLGCCSPSSQPASPRWTHCVENALLLLSDRNPSVRGHEKENNNSL